MEENNNQDAKVENNTQQVDNNCKCGDDCKCGDNCKCGKKGAPLLLTILLCIVAGGLGAFLGNKVFNMTEKKTEEKSNSNENSNSNEPKKEENTSELTEEVKNEMINKVVTLLGEKEYKKGTVINVHPSGSGIFYEIVNGNFTEEMKTLLILTAVGSDQNGNFSGDEFTKKYKNVYGVDPKYVSTGCPAQKYDKTKNMYVDGEGGCGGAWSSKDMIYIDDVIKTNDKILSVQVYVGSNYSAVDHDDDYFTDYFKSAYYDDDFNVVKSAPVTKETTITEQNKTQFTKYIINFEKSTDGNYYYKNTEKAK